MELRSGKNYTKKNPEKNNEPNPSPKEIKINSEILYECNNCGNIWDGNAQCTCWY